MTAEQAWKAATDYAARVGADAGYSPRMILRLRGAWLKGFNQVGSAHRYSNFDRPLRAAWEAGESAGRQARPCTVRSCRDFGTAHLGAHRL